MMPMQNTSPLKFVLTIFILTFCQNLKGQEKIICHGLLNLERDVNHGVGAMERMAKLGANAVMLTLWWDRVYPDTKSAGDYAQLDNQLRVAKSLGLKIALRIHVGRELKKTEGFWHKTGMAADQKGAVLNDYFITNPSFANDTAKTSITNFVTEVVKRYEYLQNEGSLIYVSVVNNQQQELGYTFVNSSGGSQYEALFDMSDIFLKQWRLWLANKYTNIKTYNYFNSLDYRNFSEPVPYVNWWNIKDSFRGKRGKDWYVFRHNKLKEFNDLIVSTIKKVNPNIKVASEYGGVTDPLSGLRGTFAIKNLSENSDIIKTSLYGIQGDLLNSVKKPTQKIYSEVAHWDYATSELLLEYTKKSLSDGCEFFMFIIENTNQKDWDKFLPAIQEGMKSKNLPIPKFNPADTIHVRTIQLIDNLTDVEERWKRASGNGSKKVFIHFEEDILLENNKIENPVKEDFPYTPPVRDPKSPNQLPVENIKNYAFDVIINNTFRYQLPYEIFYDPDGYIAKIEVLKKPEWLKFLSDEWAFYGRAEDFYSEEIELRVFDNEFAYIDVKLRINVNKAHINLEVIKADYWDQKISTYGYLENKKILFYETLPEKTSIRATCNVDSVYIYYTLRGAYNFDGVSYRPTHSIFTEGKGIQFPIGEYTLKATALKKNVEVATNELTFYVRSINDAISMPDYTVYPNPSASNFNIIMPKNYQKEKIKIELISSSGRIINLNDNSFIFTDSSISFDLNTYHSSDYHLRIFEDNKLVKQTKIFKN